MECEGSAEQVAGLQEVAEAARVIFDVANNVHHDQRDCPHGNRPVYPAHGKWCEGCFNRLEAALAAADKAYEAGRADMQAEVDWLALVAAKKVRTEERAAAAGLVGALDNIVRTIYLNGEDVSVGYIDGLAGKALDAYRAHVAETDGGECPGGEWPCRDGFLTGGIAKKQRCPTCNSGEPEASGPPQGDGG